MTSYVAVRSRLITLACAGSCPYWWSLTIAQILVSSSSAYVQDPDGMFFQLTRAATPGAAHVRPAERNVSAATRPPQ